MYAGIMEIDLHGKNEYQARVTLDAALGRAKGGTYRIRCIHGCHGGTVLRDMIRREYARHPPGDPIGGRDKRRHHRFGAAGAIRRGL